MARFILGGNFVDFRFILKSKGIFQYSFIKIK